METIASGEYGLTADFYAVINGDEPYGSPASLVYHWLQSGEGQRLIALEGFIPKGAKPPPGSKESYIPLEDIPEDYSIRDAKNANNVVFEDNKVISGQEIWEAFITQSSRRKPVFVRMARSETQVRGREPVFIIYDIEFDGRRYTLSFMDEGEVRTASYRYLREFSGRLTNSASGATEYTYYVMLNDRNIRSWAQIERSMQSYNFNDHVDYKRVYVDER
jgi:hypothetical protein